NIRIGLRTGDTPACVRRELRHDPPELLLTTPESLAVLLSHEWACALFANLRWVIVDEVHAFAAGKRGCDLSLSLERLARLAGGADGPGGRAAGERQRVAWSAPCPRASEAARSRVGVNRPCAIAAVPETARLDLTVELLADGMGFLGALVRRLEPELRRNRST